MIDRLHLGFNSDLHTLDEINQSWLLNVHPSGVRTLDRNYNENKMKSTVYIHPRVKKIKEFLLLMNGRIKPQIC